MTHLAQPADLMTGSSVNVLSKDFEICTTFTTEFGKKKFSFDSLQKKTSILDLGNEKILKERKELEVSKAQ